MIPAPATYKQKRGASKYETPLFCLLETEITSFQM